MTIQQQPTHSIVRSTLVLDFTQREAIRLGAKHSYPDEYCGLLLGRKVGTTIVVSQVVNTPNVAPRSSRHEHYEINPGLMLAWEREAEKEGLRVVGMVHSYPDHDATPSEEDMARAFPGYVYVVAGMKGDNVSSLRAWAYCEQAKEFEPVTIGE